HSSHARLGGPYAPEGILILSNPSTTRWAPDAPGHDPEQSQLPREMIRSQGCKHLSHATATARGEFKRNDARASSHPAALRPNRALVLGESNILPRFDVGFRDHVI